jgi:hypothetical protein
MQMGQRVFWRTRAERLAELYLLTVGEQAMADSSECYRWAGVSSE